MNEELRKRVLKNQKDYISRTKYKNEYSESIEANSKVIEKIRRSTNVDLLQSVIHFLRWKKFHIVKHVPYVKTNDIKNDELAIAIMIKNEGIYIKEWLDFYITMGVDRFYIFDNGSTDNTFEILKPYIESKIVILTHYPGKAVQINSYNDAIRCCKRNNTKWLALLDADEFLYPVEKGNLKDALKEYENEVGIGVNWVVYGPCGHEKRPEGYVTKAYTQTFADRNNELNLRFKSIVKPKEVKMMVSPHYALFRKKKLMVDENHVIISGGDFVVKNQYACTYKHNSSKFAINHYWTKSLEELKAKCNRGYADGAVNANYERTLERLKGEKMEDTRILRLVK